MTIHYDNEIEALNHLNSYNFQRLSNGYWISICGMVKASLHPVTGSAVVSIAYQEI